jgi:predicted PhzF superfamily epimerase YddE/YHI9
VEGLRYAALRTSPEGGNPAGVVLDAAAATEAQMQRVAAEVGDGGFAVSGTAVRISAI